MGGSSFVFNQRNESYQEHPVNQDINDFGNGGREVRQKVHPKTSVIAGTCNWKDRYGIAPTTLRFQFWYYAACGEGIEIRGLQG
jgi:hypothetical protein